MNVTITGGLGFLGRLLSRELLAAGHRVTVFDSGTAPPPPGSTLRRGDITDPAAVTAALAEGTDAVVHLASMVSAECELEPARALEVNVGGLRTVLAAAARLPRPPRLLFASSVAVFGPLPAGVAYDGAKQLPQTTYGVTKSIGELLVDEATRRGVVDGRTARLPTVIIRPGRPNAAASSFASGLFREPLAGLDAVVPVELATPIVLIGHRAAVGGLARLLALDGDVVDATLGVDRAVNLPGLEVTVAEMVAACRRRPETTGRLTVVPDPAVGAIVGSWPSRWDAGRARALGLPADTGLDAIVEDHLAERT